MDKTTKTIEKQANSKKKFDKCPIILGNGDYIPTMLQARILWLYLTNDKAVSPTQIMIDNGHNPDLWFKWKIRYKGFEGWFKECTLKAFKDRLPTLWNALWKRAETHDTAAAKLIFQRYDMDYTERSSTESKHTFAGFTPGNADKARKRMAKALNEGKE